MSTTSSSSIWLLSHMKLRFFTRIRRFIHSKTLTKRSEISTSSISSSSSSSLGQRNIYKDAMVIEKEVSEDDSLVLQRSVKRLHFGSWEEKEMAAMEIERLSRQDLKNRKLIAELGVVPPLVSMAAESEVVSRRSIALKALTQLASGTYTNKALILEAGFLSKLPNNIELLDESTKNEFADLLLSISSLANTRTPLSASDILPFLITILESSSSVKVKESCLGTLYNLSAVLENAGPLVSNGAVNTLLELSSIKDLSEKALATLGNLVVTLMGKKATEDSQMVPVSLIEILTWEDKPKCQELSAYLLMILTHQNSELKDKMAKARIVPVLLQVALLGSPLAQKRALKLLEWFKDEQRAKMGPHSGPQTGRSLTIGSPVNQMQARQGKKMMQSLVKQSLHKNMAMITKRANAATGDSSKLKSSVLSTSSKSLPY